MLTKIKLLLLMMWVLLLGFGVSLNAAEHQNISQKIIQLKTISKNKRFKLINEIKRDMAKLNAAQRSVALGQLRSTMHGKMDKKGLKRHQQNKEHTRNPNCKNHERKLDGSGHGQGQQKNKQHPQKGQPKK